MKSVRQVCLGLFLAVVAFAASAAADMTKTESFEPSNRTSLKVLEPVGAHVFVTVADEVMEDTVPAIFSLPNQDAYVNVKIVASDGEKWSGKVEIKARLQTVLRLAQAKKDGRGPGTVKFSGRLVNSTDHCSWPENLKFVITRNGEQVYAAPQMVFPGKTVPVVLDRGRYAVQALDTSGNPLGGAQQLNVVSEGWSFNSGCVKDND